MRFRFVFPVLAAVLASGRALALPARYWLDKGNAAYKKGDYEKALDNYARASAQNPKDPRPVFNAGDALYRLQQFGPAQEAFESIAASKNPRLQSRALYNRGNSLYRLGQYKQAAENFKQAILLNPQDRDAKINYFLALQQMKSPQRPQGKDQPKNQNQKNGQNQKKGQPPQSQDRNSRSGMSREDAERILQALKEKEKSDFNPDILNSRFARRKAKRENPKVEEDW